MSEESLWGELPIEEQVETPAWILKQQAMALQKVTHGILDARIVTTNMGEELEHAFRIVAPALGNYSTEILTVRHPAELFPVEVRANWGAWREAKDADDLKLKLKEVLQSDRTRRVVRGLVAQSRDLGAPKQEEEEIPF